MTDFALVDLGIRYAGHPRGWMDWSSDELADRMAHWMIKNDRDLE